MIGNVEAIGGGWLGGGKEGDGASGLAHGAVSPLEAADLPPLSCSAGHLLANGAASPPCGEAHLLTVLSCFALR